MAAIRAASQVVNGVCQLANQSAVLISVALRVLLLVADLELLFDPWVVLVERNFVSLCLLVELARRHFEDEVVVLLVVEDLQSKNS